MSDDPTITLKPGETTTLRHPLTDAQLDYHLDKPIPLTLTCAKCGRHHTAPMTLKGGTFDINCRVASVLVGRSRGTWTRRSRSTRQ